MWPKEVLPTLDVVANSALPASDQLLLSGYAEHDRAVRALCQPIGKRHLAVPLDRELKFRTTLLKLGYVLSGQPTPG